MKRVFYSSLTGLYLTPFGFITSNLNEATKFETNTTPEMINTIWSGKVKFADYYF